MTLSLRATFQPRHFAIVAVVLTAAASASLAPAVAQSRTSEAADWKVPRTSHGHPDLQGNWTNATLTPVERPEDHDAVLTEEQVVAIEEGQAADVAAGSAPSDPDRAPPPSGGEYPVCIDTATGCYNEVYREPGERVAVVNGEARSSLITRPADGQVPELTTEGQQRIEVRRDFRGQFGPEDHPELLPLAQRCLVSFGSNAGPPMLPNYWYNNNYTIVQTADHVMIMTEMVHDARIIRLGEPTLQPPEIRPWFGDSWGRWEEDTLVVETTNMNPEHALRGVPPSSEHKVTERFTRVDEDTIVYEFTVDDPTMFTGVWGGQVPFERFDALVYEYACHEGNYSLANVLRGARYEEQAEERR